MDELFSPAGLASQVLLWGHTLLGGKHALTEGKYHLSEKENTFFTSKNYHFLLFKQNVFLGGGLKLLERSSLSRQNPR